MTIRQFFVNWGDAAYYKTLERELADMDTVLDVGCGSWSPLENIKRNFHSVGVDIHSPSIKEIKKLKIHNEYKIGDVLTINKLFKKKSFDAVIALDVVEHFAKKEGNHLIDQMESLATKKVIIVTPYGFTKQTPYDGNPYQEHKSGWYINEFKKRGYRVYGMRGFRFIRGEYATIRYKPWIFWGIVATLSQLFTYFIPSMAYQIFAVKKYTT